MFHWILYIIPFIISVVTFWEGYKIWREGNKLASIATIILSVSIVVVSVILFMG